MFLSPRFWCSPRQRCKTVAYWG